MKGESYDDFVEKFRPKRTTDDCYTPPEVYAVVLAHVGSRYVDLTGRPVVRPFRQGGDYEREVYPPRCVVIDNPPFSILSRIVRFYSEKGIDFFLFAPTLTLFNLVRCGCTAVVCGVDVIYENGAKVNTSFVTSLVPELAFRVDGTLCRAVADAQAPSSVAKERRRITYPDTVVTAALMKRIGRHGFDFEVRCDEAVFVSRLDCGVEIFGGGMMISERAAAERVSMEASLARNDVAALKRATGEAALSPREIAVVKSLAGKGDNRE